MASPLGPYAAISSSVTTVGIIAVYLVSLIFKNVLVLDPATLANLHDLAILAFGAIVGSAVAVNGYKQPLAALAATSEQHTSQIATLGTVAAEIHPTAAPIIAEVIKPV